MTQEVNKRCFECHQWNHHTIDCPVQSVEVRLQNHKDLIAEMRRIENHRISLTRGNMTHYHQGRIATLILENNALRKANKKLKKQLMECQSGLNTVD